MAKHGHLKAIVAKAKTIYKKGEAGVKWTTAIKRASASLHTGGKKKAHKKKARKSPVKKRKKHRRIRGL